MSEETTPGDVIAAIRATDDPAGSDILCKLAEVLEQGFSESATRSLKKHFDSIAYDIESDLQYSLKENLASELAIFTADMAKKAIELLLSGDENSFRSCLNCQPGAYRGTEDARIYDGKLHEYEFVGLRRKIVDEFAETLKSERIIDLEGQVASLVKKIGEHERQIARLNELRRSGWSG